MKLTPVQIHKIRTAHKDASDVLREIKQKPVKRKDLTAFHELQDAVQILECFQMSVSGK